METDLDKQDLDMQHLIDKYNNEGYIHIADFFPKKVIENLRNDAQEIFKKQLVRLQLAEPQMDEHEFEQAMYVFFETDLQTFINCGKQAQHLISLRRLSLDEKLVDLLTKMGLNIPIVSTRPVLFFNSRFLAKKESYWKTPAHQDWRSIQGSINSVVVWVPLLDIDTNLGAVEAIPKSHLEGLVSEETIDSFGVVSSKFKKDELFVPLEVKQGDIVLFSQFLIHRSGNNITNSIRWSCHFRFNDLDELSFIERGFPHTYVYHPDDTLLFPNFETKPLIQKYFSNNE